jgi:hypothetical protein
MSNITIENILACAAKGPNYGLAAVIVRGEASDSQLQTAARMIANEVGAATYLQAAIDLMPTRKVTTRRTRSNKGTTTPAPTVATVTTVTEVELTPFQKAVNADPATYGVGFGGKRKARGLPSLTADQRTARKALYASLNPASV